jgi:predicted RNA-binding protein with PIN domain
MVETLVVDGYNVLSAFASHGLVDREDIDRARFQLINLLTSSAAYWGMGLIVVFDAMHVSGGVVREESMGPNAKVIFSAEGVSADTVIEGIIAQLSRTERIFIATSDQAEQNYAFGKGAVRWPARELCNRVRVAQSEMRERQAPARVHHTLHGRLSPGVLAVLDRLRLESVQPRKDK